MTAGDKKKSEILENEKKFLDEVKKVGVVSLKK